VITIGLTGSIGMGKTTTAELFKKRGVPVFDADACVRRLYDGPLTAAIEAAFPGVSDGRCVDRQRLAAALADRPEALARLEALVHPAVAAAERAFLAEAAAAGADLAVLDVPLLLETGGDRRVDLVVVVSAPPDVQRQRVLVRPGMSAEKFEALLARQLSDREKRARADVVIDTGQGMAVAEATVAGLIDRLLRGKSHDGG
jgi:dephospho-CoA kinase